MSSRKTVVKRELYLALEHFVQRQHLVADAVVSFGIDLDRLGEFGALAWVSSVSSIEPLTPADIFGGHDTPLGEATRRAEERRVPQVGLWRDEHGGEWRYVMHGCGCSLTNLITGEPLDWDAPDVLSFDPWRFLPHLKWRLKDPSRCEDLAHLADWVGERGIDAVQDLVDELHNAGYITGQTYLVEPPP